MTMLQRALRRTMTLLERQPRPEPWLVDLRLHRTGSIAAMHPQIVSLGATHADWHPPAAGPEIQVTLEIWATTGEIAERQARRRADGQGLEVLASRVWQWPGDIGGWHDEAPMVTDAEMRTSAEADPRWAGGH